MKSASDKLTYAATTAIIRREQRFDNLVGWELCQYLGDGEPAHTPVTRRPGGFGRDEFVKLIRREL